MLSYTLIEYLGKELHKYKIENNNLLAGNNQLQTINKKIQEMS